MMVPLYVSGTRVLGSQSPANPEKWPAAGETHTHSHTNRERKGGTEIERKRERE